MGAMRWATGITGMVVIVGGPLMATTLPGGAPLLAISTVIGGGYVLGSAIWANSAPVSDPVVTNHRSFVLSSSQGDPGTPAVFGSDGPVPNALTPPPVPAVAPVPWQWSTSRIFYGGLVLAAFAMLCPPWQYWINNASVRRTQPALRELIFTPPKQLQGWSLGIDFGRLAVEVGGIALLTAAGLAIRRGTVRGDTPGKA